MPTSLVNLSTDNYVRINTSLNPLVLQAHRDKVHITLSESQPVKSNTVFHLLGGEDQPLQFNFIDTNVWALAISDTSSLTVTEVQPSDIDVSGSRIMITHEHSKVHEGKFFSIGYYDLAVIDDAYIDILFTPPATDSIHMYIKLVSGGDALFSAYENTVATHGTSITSVNHDRTSANTCGCTASHTPTVTTVEDLLWGEVIPGGTGTGSGGSSHTPGAVQGVSTEQVILAPDTNYLFRLQNISGVTDHLQIMMAYYPVAA